MNNFITMLPIEELHRHAKARALNDDALAALADSINQVGLINPIRVRKADEGYEIIAGHHRFAACDSLGHRGIACIVVEDDDIRAELAMIDENLFRADLTPSERATQTARRKFLYEALHPETKHGESLGNLQVANLATRETERFSAATAKATGQSERAIQRDAERGEKVIDEALNAVRGTKLDTGVYLDKIKNLSPNEQMIAVKRDLAWERKKDRDDQPRQGGIAGRIETKQAPTYEEMRAAILLLRELTADDMTRICPPAKRAAMCQQLSALIVTFEQVKESVSA
ncbi:MAG: ParB/RepB/Spo0J family partition protein [Mesorhizobium sp.]|uniref:ParB/RepB/Spo0J family partition protein n=1 Tax=Mesorhizobium sp. TaxID=1871066 RepID=UPI001214ED38|nr:ParB N-terminal domain-containing protein [Mesorhizobium sp.]TIO14904.1 MAG: ParB/RepB/Spo0J family partition protein [Mesorhizobium sp.]